MKKESDKSVKRIYRTGGGSAADEGAGGAEGSKLIID